MNNKNAFQKWLATTKELSPRLCKFNMRIVQGLDKEFHVFEAQNVEDLKINNNTEAFALSAPKRYHSCDCL